jgi:hypothetical protein
MWTALIVGVGSIMAIALGAALPGGFSLGHLGVHWGDAKVEFSRSSDPIVWNQGRWEVTSKGSRFGLLLAPDSQWIPSNASAGATLVTAPGGKSIVMVDSVFVPLLPFAGIGILLAAVLRKEFPPEPPLGHCRSCGYSLIGLPPGSKCPECGS